MRTTKMCLRVYPEEGPMSKELEAPFSLVGHGSSEFVRCCGPQLMQEGVRSADFRESTRGRRRGSSRVFAPQKPNHPQPRAWSQANDGSGGTCSRDISCTQSTRMEIAFADRWRDKGRREVCNNKVNHHNPKEETPGIMRDIKTRHTPA